MCTVRNRLLSAPSTRSTFKHARKSEMNTLRATMISRTEILGTPYTLHVRGSTEPGSSTRTLDAHPKPSPTPALGALLVLVACGFLRQAQFLEPCVVERLRQVATTQGPEPERMPGFHGCQGCKRWLYIQTSRLNLGRREVSECCRVFGSSAS